MAFYRGMDGSVQWNSQAVSQITQWTANSSLEVLATTKMGDAWATATTGLGSWSASFSTRLDYGDTNGQKVVIDALLAATPSATAVALQLRMTSTTKYLGGNAYVTGVRVVQQMGAIIELSVDVTGTGALTPTWS